MLYRRAMPPIARHPRGILVACAVPWDDRDRFLESLFREQVRQLVAHGFPRQYVFGTVRPRNERTPRFASGTGMDVSPAVRDCLGFQGINNAENRVDWQFVDFKDVPDGPWKEIITTSQVFWE